MCVSFGVPIEMRGLVMALGGLVVEGRGDRIQWYEGIKRNNGTGKVKRGKGWKGKVEDIYSEE